MNATDDLEFEVDNENNIDWDELIPKTPKYYDLTSVMILLTIFGILLGILILRAAILGF